MTANNYSYPNPISHRLKAIRAGFNILGNVMPEFAGKVALNLFLTPHQKPPSKNGHPIFQQAQSTTVAHGSRQLAAFVWEGNGPTILLVHGWGSNATRMRGFIRPLLNQGFRVIAFDAPAHGNSTGKQTTLLDYSGAIQSIIQTLGPVEGVVAHSFGAATTLLMLSRMPDIGVKYVVAIGSPSDPNKMVRIWTSVLGLRQKVVEKMRQRLVDKVGIPFESLVVATAVSHLTISGLLIHDKNDSIVPYSEGAAIARRWKTAELVTTEGLDHRGALYDPQIIRQITTSLAKHIGKEKGRP